MAFVEKTDLERGFAALWDKEIDPSLGAYRTAFMPRLWLAVAGIPICILLAYFLSGPLSAWMLSVWPDMDRFPFIITFILTVAAIVAISYPLSKVQGSFDDFLKRVVSDHYGDILLAAENDKNATHIINQMQTLDVMPHGRRRLSNHYTGTYRDCALELFNIRLTSGSGKNEGSQYFFVMDVTVPIEFEGDVVIKSDYGRLFNLFRALFSERKQVAFEHKEFERKFEVYTADEELARRLINPAFCDNLLAIPSLFPRAYGVTPVYLRAAFHDGHFTMVVPGNSDLFALLPHQSTPGQIEAACRRLIARMGIAKTAVDYLHGAR